jgi:putative membrane protein
MWLDFSAWPIYVKIALFAAVGLISLKPTMTFIRWRRALDQDRSWSVPAAEHALMRKLVMAEVHLAALIPIVAVIMARGLGR